MVPAGQGKGEMMIAGFSCTGPAGRLQVILSTIALGKGGLCRLRSVPTSSRRPADVGAMHYSRER